MYLTAGKNCCTTNRQPSSSISLTTRLPLSTSNAAMKRGINDLDTQSRQHKITDHPEFTKQPETPEPQHVNPSGAARPCDRPEQLAAAAGLMHLGVGARVSKRRRRNADTAGSAGPEDVIDLTEDGTADAAAGIAGNCSGDAAAAAGTHGDAAAAAGMGAVAYAAAVVKVEPGLVHDQEQVEQQQQQLLPFQQQHLCSWDMLPQNAAAHAAAAHAPDTAPDTAMQVAEGPLATPTANTLPVGQPTQAGPQQVPNVASLAAAPAAVSGRQSQLLAALQTALTAESAAAAAAGPVLQQHEPQAGRDSRVEQPAGKACSSEPADAAAAVSVAAAGEAQAAAAAAATAAAAAAGTSTAAGLTVPQLKSLLQQVCADKSDAKEHIIPVRYLAKLLHGQDVDLSNVQLAELLPQVGFLLSYMRDRVGGKVEGKSSLQPRNAAKHAKCMLHVLGLQEVQAVLGGQQQTQGLLDAVQAAQQEFEAMCSSSEGVTTSAQPASRQTTTEQHAGEAKLAQEPPIKREGNGVRSSRGAACAGAGAGAGAAAAGVAAEGRRSDAARALSAAQLSDLFAAHDTPRTIQQKVLTTVKQLVMLVHGKDAGPGDVQLGPLLLQWPVLQEHLQQRMDGETGLKALRPVSALFYANSVHRLLAMQEVQQQLSADELQQLEQQVAATTAAWKSMEAAAEQPTSAGTQQVLLQPKLESGISEGAQGGSHVSASSNDGSSSEESDDDYRASSPAANSLGLAIPTKRRTRRTRPAKSARPQRSCAAAAAAAIASAAREERTSSAAWAQRLRKALQAEDSSALKPPAAAAKAAPASERQGNKPAQAEDSSAPKPPAAGKAARQASKPAKAEGSTLHKPSAAAAALPVSIKQEDKQAAAMASAAAAAGSAVAAAAATVAAAAAAAEDAPPPEATAAPQASSAEVQDSPAQGPQHNPGQVLPGMPAPGLSLQQLHTLTKQQCEDEDVSSKFCAIRLLARLVHGGQYDPAAVQVGDLIRQWDVLERHILQRVAGAIKELPVLAVGTALGYANQILTFTREPIVQAQLTEQEVEQVQRKIMAAKGILGSGTVMKVKARLQVPAPGLQQADQAGSSERQHLPGAQHYVFPAAAAAAAGSAAAAAGQERVSGDALAQSAAAAQASARPAAMSAQVSTPATTAPASRAAARSRVVPAAAARCPVDMELERDLITAQRQLLWLYTHRLSPSLSSKLLFRSTMQMMAGLPPDDIRLDRFWADYDWVLVLSEDPDSQPEHLQEAFDTLLSNTARCS